MTGRRGRNWKRGCCCCCGDEGADIFVILLVISWILIEICADTKFRTVA